MRTRLAFTIVELLVVIGILVVLAGIILAVLPAARQRSYEVHCMSNLHQLGAAYAAYQQDWGGVEADAGRFYEPWQLGLPPKVIELDMEKKVIVYIGTFELWQCPLGIDSPYAIDYGVNYTACFEPDQDQWDPDGACGLWRHAVYRLGQEAFLAVDLNHWDVCAIRRSGTCPVLILNINHEVRRFMARWDAPLKEILWKKH